jgi:hypothetical protein
MKFVWHEIRQRHSWARGSADGVLTTQGGRGQPQRELCKCPAWLPRLSFRSGCPQCQISPQQALAALESLGPVWQLPVQGCGGYWGMALVSEGWGQYSLGHLPPRAVCLRRGGPEAASGRSIMIWGRRRIPRASLTLYWHRRVLDFHWSMDSELNSLYYLPSTQTPQSRTGLWSSEVSQPPRDTWAWASMPPS